jgi:hypothetical protein
VIERTERGLIIWRIKKKDTVKQRGNRVKLQINNFDGNPDILQ